MLSVPKKQKSESLYSLALKARKENRYTEYISILNQGLEEGDADCIYLLAQCYYFGYYRIEKNKDKANELFKKNKHHDKSIVFDLQYNGYLLLDYSIINNLKNHYAKGIYFYYLCDEESYEINAKAFEEFLKSAEEGDDEAQFECGILLINGYGIDKNEQKAMEWFVKSAEQGNIHAIRRMIHQLEYTDILYKHEGLMYWYKKEYFASKMNQLAFKLRIVHNEEVKDCDQLDSLINLHLARYYFAKKNDYLSWYFFKKTNEIDGKKELKLLEEKTFSEFVRIYKVILTVLCIGKFSPYPKEVFVMIAKEIWKTIK